MKNVFIKKMVFLVIICMICGVSVYTGANASEKNFEKRIPAGEGSSYAGSITIDKSIDMRGTGEKVANVFVQILSAPLTFISAGLIDPAKWMGLTAPNEKSEIANMWDGICSRLSEKSVEKISQQKKVVDNKKITDEKEKAQIKEVVESEEKTREMQMIAVCADLLTKVPIAEDMVNTKFTEIIDEVAPLNRKPKIRYYLEVVQLRGKISNKNIEVNENIQKRYDDYIKKSMQEGKKLSDNIESSLSPSEEQGKKDDVPVYGDVSVPNYPSSDQDIKLPSVVDEFKKTWDD